MVIWIIGLAGSGKTVIGQSFYKSLKKKYQNLVFLDGDIIREVMGSDLGHTVEDRRKNAERICRLCKMLDLQNIHVVCCILSLFSESREWNRKNYKQYFEIYVDASLKVLIKRNKKELYTRALKGEIKNVVGVDIPFNPPKSPDYVIKNYKERSNFDDIVKEIIKALPNIE